MKGKRPVLIYFCYQTDSEVPNTSIYSVPFSWRLHITITYNLPHLRLYVDVVTVIA